MFFKLAILHAQLCHLGHSSCQIIRPHWHIIIHTDRGSQYTSKKFETALKLCGFEHSMSRRGNPYDNAVMESFYRTLKRELVKGSHYENPEQARLDIFKYIECYYNTKRMHSALNYMSPVEFEKKFC